MLEQLSQDPLLIHNDSHIRQVIDYLKDKIQLGNILDVGRVSPLTEAISENFHYSHIYNTAGDLDTDFTFPVKIYDTIIYSHTIEHQFNPLYTLLRLKEVADAYTRIFIILPSRTKLLWDKGHFHEIDHYRMKLLIERAGMRIVTYERRKAWRKWYTYFYGFRPLMRLFLEYNAYYMIQL